MFGTEWIAFCRTCNNFIKSFEKPLSSSQMLNYNVHAGWVKTVEVSLLGVTRVINVHFPYIYIHLQEIKNNVLNDYH